MENVFLKTASVVQLLQAIEDTATSWGKVPANPIQVTQAFSNDPADRPLQDAGFDGLDDAAEAVKFQQYLNDLRASFGEASAIYQQALADPARDNFKKLPRCFFYKPRWHIRKI